MVVHGANLMIIQQTNPREGYIPMHMEEKMYIEYTELSTAF